MVNSFQLLDRTNSICDAQTKPFIISSEAVVDKVTLDNYSARLEELRRREDEARRKRERYNEIIKTIELFEGISHRIPELDSDGLYFTDVFDHMDVTPSAIKIPIRIHHPDDGSIYLELVKFVDAIQLVTPSELLRSPRYVNEMILTVGTVTGQALLYQSRINLDPPFILEDSNGTKVSCVYNEYNPVLRNRGVRLVKETRYDNGSRGRDETSPEELYAFIDSARSTGELILVGGRIIGNRLVADLFNFGKAHAFAYLIRGNTSPRISST